jgi:hypothetical protein
MRSKPFLAHWEAAGKKSEKREMQCTCITRRQFAVHMARPYISRSSPVEPQKALRKMIPYFFLAMAAIL